jgi:hypothetical protein
MGIKPRPGNHDRMTRIGLAGSRRQENRPSCRTGHDHVPDCRGTVHTETEVAEQTHAARTDQITAGLVASENTLVDQRNSGASASQDERGDAARGTSPDDDDVVTCFRQ